MGNSLEKDKILHFVACAVITSLIGVLGLLLIEKPLNIVIGTFVGLFAGFAKEVYDLYFGGTGWDWQDIVADCYGIVCGIIILLFI